MSILLKSGHQIFFIGCDVVEGTMNHGVEFCSEEFPPDVCVQSDEQFIPLEEVLLAVCNAQFDAGAFIGDAAVQNEKKDIRLKHIVPV